VLLGLVAACGGGGIEAPDAASRASVPCVSGTTQKIQLFGDSTQWLAGPYWQARWPGRVINSAVGGTKSTDLLAGIDGVNKPWPQSVMGDIVVIKFGTNDATPARGQTPLPVFKDTLRALFHGTSARVIFETPDPNTDSALRPDVYLYTQAVRDVAKELGTPLIDTDACWRAHPGWEAWLTDGTHASPEGRQFTVDQCVAPVMEALQCSQ